MSLYIERQRIGESEMICYIIRHGKDDDSVRGGWSDTPLSAEGIRQVQRLSAEILTSEDMDIGAIYASDLPRARQTAQIISSALSVPVIEMPEFREVNNGALAGMKNQVAEEQYPGLYWSTLDWEQAYPDGESPCQFYHRIADAWHRFKQSVHCMEHNVILVTHGGVINVIQCIEHGIPYSNKINPFPIRNAEMIGVALS